MRVTVHLTGKVKSRIQTPACHKESTRVCTGYISAVQNGEGKLVRLDLQAI